MTVPLCRGGNLPPAAEQTKLRRTYLFVQNNGFAVGDGALDVPQTSAENYGEYICLYKIMETL